MNVSVFDFHCDTASKLVGWNGQEPASLWKNLGHVDLERASKLAAYAQCFACFTTPLAEQWCATPARESFQLQLAAIRREVEKNQDRIAFAASARMVDVNHISDEGFWDMMNITNGPIIATHSNSRSVWNNSRNLSDDIVPGNCAVRRRGWIQRL